MSLSDELQQLALVLKGLSNPDDHERSKFEHTLTNMRNQDGFVRALMALVNNDQLDLSFRVTAVCCLNDNVKNFYKERTGEIITDNDKNFIKSNIIASITMNMNISQIRQTYQEILSLIVESDYPQAWPTLVDELLAAMKGSQRPEHLYGSLLVAKSIVKTYQRAIDQSRLPLEIVVERLFPYFENLLVSQIKGWNEESGRLCELLLSTFCMSIWMQIPRYFTADRLRIWMTIIKTLIQKQIPETLTIKLTSWDDIISRSQESEWKIKSNCMKIASRMAFHCSATPKSEWESELFKEHISKYALPYFETAYMCISSYNKQYVSPKMICYSLATIRNSLEIDDIFKMAEPHLEPILLDSVIPLLALNNKDSEFWDTEPAQFIYSQRVKSDDHNMIKNAAEETIDYLSGLEVGNELLLYKIVNFIGFCFVKGGNPRNGEQIGPLQKEYLLNALDIVGERLQYHKSLIDQLPGFFEQYVIPELMSDHDVLRARACMVYAAIGAIVEYGNPNTYILACQGICNCLSSGKLPIQVAAAESLHVFLAHPAARELLGSDLNQILNLILSIMSKIELDELVVALEGIIKEFGGQAGQYTVRLVHELTDAFFQYKSNVSQPKDQDMGDELLGDEGTRAAEASLSTINNILKSNLDNGIYVEVSPDILRVFNSTILNCDDVSFDKCLALLNLLLYKANQLNDQLIFYFPLICYLIIGKPQGQPNVDINTFPEELQEVIAKVNTKRRWFENLSVVVGCFLNFMQKCGPDFLVGNDFYGNSFVELLFHVVRRIGDECMKTKNFGNLLYSLRIIMGLLENFRGKVDNHLAGILQIVKELLGECQGNKDSLKSMVLQVVAMMLWYNPTLTVDLLRSQNYFEELLTVWFDHLAQFESEHEKERELYGIVALLSLPDGTLPHQLSIGAVMREILQASQHLLILRKSKRGALEAEVDNSVPETGSNVDSNKDDDCSDSDDDVSSIYFRAAKMN